MSPPDVREHTDAVITVLEALDLKVGDAVWSGNPEDDAPYVVVYPIPGGSTSGTLGAPDDDAEIVIQVSCVGKSREQAEWLADKAKGLLGIGTLDVDSRYIPLVSLDMFGGIMRDDSVTPPLFTAAPRFRIITTPA